MHPSCASCLGLCEHVVQYHASSCVHMRRTQHRSPERWQLLAQLPEPPRLLLPLLAHHRHHQEGHRSQPRSGSQPPLSLAETADTNLIIKNHKNITTTAATIIATIIATVATAIAATTNKLCNEVVISIILKITSYIVNNSFIK